jgi:hypothetical protein
MTSQLSWMLRQWLAFKALLQDFSILYSWAKPSSNGLPWAKPNPLPGHEAAVKKTLFGQRYLSITLDEAHGFRNIGTKHASALLILSLAKIRLIMTATPLQTSTKVDIFSYFSFLGWA